MPGGDYIPAGHLPWSGTVTIRTPPRAIRAERMPTVASYGTSVPRAVKISTPLDPRRSFHTGTIVPPETASPL